MKIRANKSKPAANTKPVKAKRQQKSRTTRTNNAEECGDNIDLDARNLIKGVRSTSRRSAGIGRVKSTILPQFSSIEGLLEDDSRQRQKKAVHEAKLQAFRRDREELLKENVEIDGGLIREMMQEISQGSFVPQLEPSTVSEKPKSRRCIFRPSDKLPQSPRFKATTAELKSRLGDLYRMIELGETNDVIMLFATRVIFPFFDVSDTEQGHESPNLKTGNVPARICSWIFITMATHEKLQVIKGCLKTLILLLSDESAQYDRLTAGLPDAASAYSLDAVSITAPIKVSTIWRPTAENFINVFKMFGLQLIRRTNAMSQGNERPTIRSYPIWTRNMKHILLFMVMALRASALKLHGHDALSIIHLLLTMQMDQSMHPDLIHIAWICIGEILQSLSDEEWNRKWGSSFISQIVGFDEMDSLYDSPSDWLNVARQFSHTERGRQVAVSLAAHTLQRCSKTPLAMTTSTNEVFVVPIPADSVREIVRNAVIELSDHSVRSICTETALIDVILQSSSNVFSFQQISKFLSELDGIADAYRSTMNAKWHELKTLLNLMHRKYSILYRMPSPERM